MQLRNRLLALFCLLVFIGCGFLYFNAWVVQKPFGIILFVGDGLTPQTLAVARIFAEGPNRRLHLESFPHLALVSNEAQDLAVPDTAAAATALATGTRVNTATLGLAPGGAELTTLLDLARKSGRAVGLVTTGSITDPGSAAFLAHSPDPADVSNIAAQLTADSLPDVLFGGGEQDFLPTSKGGRRRDGRDILLELRDAGIDVIRSRSDLDAVGGFRTARLLGLFGTGNLLFSDRIGSDSRQPDAVELVRRAIESLQFHPGGYLLVVDMETITRAAQQNEGERVLRETLLMDAAIETAGRYAGDNSLIIAVGKHATGGMTLNASPLREENGVAILGTNAQGIPAITWATGPAGPGGPREATAPPGDLVPEPAAVFSPNALNNASDVLAVGKGRGSEAIDGFMENTEIFGVIRDQL